MGESCREMTLIEYIKSLDIDEHLKKRMLDLYEREIGDSVQKDKCLHNCHKRIDELERTIVELSTELGKAKLFIREQVTK